MKWLCTKKLVRAHGGTCADAHTHTITTCNKEETQVDQTNESVHEFHWKNTWKARASPAETGLVTSIGLAGSLEGEYLCFEILVLLLQSRFVRLGLVHAVSDAEIVFEQTMESTLRLMELGLQSLTLLDLLLKLVFEIKIRAALD